jgi:hypothetical protein
MMKSRQLFYHGLILILTLASFPLQASSVRIFSLSADNWARPRSGEVLPQMEPLRLAVSYWASLDDAGLMLSYPGEDSGELWAAELKDWLISLGIPSDYIYLSPGLKSNGELRILVGHTQELEL